MDPVQPTDERLAGLTEQLAHAGFVAAAGEARRLLTFAGDDSLRLTRAVERRMTGEPLAWITGFTTFCGNRVHVAPGVYVPRWQTQPLVRRAVSLLPADGRAIDVCTGSGAVARTLSVARPGARVVATDIDATAVACARRNGVDAVLGDLFDPLPRDLEHTVDVVIGVVPYVPTDELPRLPSDTFAFETALAYGGGDDGLAILGRVITDARRFLRPGGSLLLETGGNQDLALRDNLSRNHYGDPIVFVDEDGDRRGIEARVDDG